MALKTSYLAAENSAMERRSRALHRFLVGSPILLLIAVGLVAHLPKPPYAHPAGNADYDRKVMAYRPRVAAAQTLSPREKATPTPAIDREAQAWADGFSSGELVAITSATYEDHFRDGVRGEIVRVGLDLAGALNMRTEEVTDPNEQARMAELSCEVGFGLRGFDLQSHLQAMLLVRRNMTLLTRIWPKLSPATRDSLTPKLRHLLVDPNEIDDLVNIEVVQFKDYIRRQKLKQADLDADPRYGSAVTQEEEAAARRGAISSNERIRALLGDAKGQ